MEPEKQPIFKISTPASGIDEISCPTCATQFYPVPLPSWNKKYCSEKCWKFDMRGKNPIEYLKGCNVPTRYLNCTFENFKVDGGNNTAFKTLQSLKKIRDIIYICGDVGTGKTHLSVALARNIRTSQPEGANFQSATNVLLQLRAGFSKDVSEKESLRHYQKSQILIIDDLGAEKLSEYVIQAWYSIVDYRYSNMLPTVITSNLTVAEIAERFGDRIASRIASGIVLTLKGNDRRLEKWRK